MGRSDLDDGLINDDVITDSDEPLDDVSLGEALTDVG
jgi:hypothetical protein